MKRKPTHTEAEPVSSDDEKQSTEKPQTEEQNPAPRTKAKRKSRRRSKAKSASRPPTKAKAKAERTFPRFSIEESRRIADAIKEYNGGNPWTPAEVASALEMGARSSGFFYLTASSRDYGLTHGTRNTARIELSDLGRRLAYPKSAQEESEAVRDAFASVEVFKRVLDYYQGGKLPEIQYLKNTLKTEFGIAEELQDEFQGIYQRSLSYLESKGDLPSGGPAEIAESQAAPGSIILGESPTAGKLVAFVAMPFAERTSTYPKGYFDEVLKRLITPAAVKADFNARTAKKAGSEVIQSTIVNDLDSADLVIVDLTEHNPNVLFELGMRIAFGKPVCLIRARGTAAIFDIDHMLRVYDYSPTLWPSTLEIDIPALAEHIAETWKNKESDRSYLSILRENK